MTAPHGGPPAHLISYPLTQLLRRCAARTPLAAQCMLRHRQPSYLTRPACLRSSQPVIGLPSPPPCLSAPAGTRQHPRCAASHAAHASVPMHTRVPSAQYVQMPRARARATRLALPRSAAATALRAMSSRHAHLARCPACRPAAVNSPHATSSGLRPDPELFELCAVLFWHARVLQLFQLARLDRLQQRLFLLRRCAQARALLQV